MDDSILMNSTSETKPSSSSFIIISLDSESYIAGAKAAGKIMLVTSLDLPRGIITLHSKGVEKIKVYNSQNLTKTLIKERSEIFAIKSCIKSWDTLSSGHYTYPFTLKIPSYSPSTFGYSSKDPRGNQIHASICYRIKVTLRYEEYVLTNNQTILIYNKSALSNPKTFIEKTEEVKGCCTSNGSAKFQLSIINKEHCEANGSVAYKLVPDNLKCKASIKSVKCRVIQELDINTEIGQFKIVKDDEINRNSRVERLSSSLSETDFEYIMKLKFNSINNASSNCTPLIKCSYYLEVLVYYDNLCRSKPVSILLPFHVNPVRDAPVEGYALPEDWNPEVAEVINLIVKGKSEFTQKHHLPKIISPDIFIDIY